MHPGIHQIYEIRLLPVLAAALLGAAFLVLLVAERHPARVAKVLVAAGVGAMGFSFFRWGLVAAYFDNQVWFGTWEEITELLSVAFVAGVLYVFRLGLAERPAAPAPAGGGA
jgi:hypothetical protein